VKFGLDSFSCKSPLNFRLITQVILKQPLVKRKS